jgi:hypothetical protein
MNGGGFHQSRYGTFDQGMAENDLKQRKAKADYEEYLRQQQRMFQNGQQNAGGQTPQPQQPQQPGFITGNPIGASLQNQMMNPQQSSPMVTGGTSMQGQAPPTSNPFFGGGVVGAADLNSLFNKGVDNTETRTTQKETQRHNTADENQTAYRDKTGRLVYEATRDNIGGYHKFPPPAIPPQPNAASRAKEALDMGLITPEQYARTLGALDKPTASSQKDTTLEGLMKASNATTQAYGAKSPQAQAAAERVNNYVQNRGSGILGMPSPNGLLGNKASGLPFGGGSNENLKSAPSKLSLSIYPGKNGPQPMQAAPLGRQPIIEPRSINNSGKLRLTE